MYFRPCTQAFYVFILSVSVSSFVLCTALSTERLSP